MLIFSRALSALSHIHAGDLVLRNMTATHVLTPALEIPVLSDLGLAACLSDEGQIHGGSGTLGYCAPGLLPAGAVHREGGQQRVAKPL